MSAMKPESSASPSAGAGPVGSGSGSGSDVEPDGLESLEDTYERERRENIENNAALLASLGLSSLPSVRPPKPKPTAQKAKSTTTATPRRNLPRRTVASDNSSPYSISTRRSGRVAARESEAGNGDIKPVITKPLAKPLPRNTLPVIPSGPEYEHDPGVAYPNAPIPGRGKDGRLIFEGRWKGIFTPNITPQEMFDGGAFGGGFFADTYSNILRAPLSSSSALSSLPFTPLRDRERLYANPDPDGEHNRFKVRAGQSLQEWEKARWIWNGDPRGWAEWYTRFWGGRRCVDDERQVRRWLKVAGPTGRFKRALLKKIHGSGGEPTVADEEVGKVLRQCLWQWGYEMTLGEYRRALKEE